MKLSELAMKYFPMKSEAETHSGLPFCMIILRVQEQLFLWYKNSYSCGARTVIIVVQEQLLL